MQSANIYRVSAWSHWFSYNSKVAVQHQTPELIRASDVYTSQNMKVGTIGALEYFQLGGMENNYIYVYKI